MKNLTFTLVFVGAIACAMAGYYYPHHGGGDEAGAGDHHHEGHSVDYHTHPHYKFDYGVEDPHTGDHKSQWEERDGDKVKGEYTLYDADGTKRVVEYTSDKHHGFQAVVKRIGHANHPSIYGHDDGQHHHPHHNDIGAYSSGSDDHHHGHGHGHATSYANIHQHY